MLARLESTLKEYTLKNSTTLAIILSSLVLSNTLLIFYVTMPKSGRYISYQVNAGKEICDIVDSTKNISNYAPIIHMASKISSLPTKTKDLSDQFHPIQVNDLGSLARLTYDPELPDEQNLTLYALPFKNSWVLGYVTSLDMDEVYYNFNYVKLDSKPLKNFVKYQGIMVRIQFSQIHLNMDIPIYQ